MALVVVCLVARWGRSAHGLLPATCAQYGRPQGGLAWRFTEVDGWCVASELYTTLIQCELVVDAGAESWLVEYGFGTSNHGV